MWKSIDRLFSSVLTEIWKSLDYSPSNSTCCQPHERKPYLMCAPFCQTVELKFQSTCREEMWMGRKKHLHKPSPLKGTWSPSPQKSKCLFGLSGKLYRKVSSQASRWFPDLINPSSGPVNSRRSKDSCLVLSKIDHDPSETIFVFFFHPSA